ncbi:nucleotidyltransferase family protein, partial [Paenibacillus xylanexedens]|uniref:nucleotidyltransferase family protein n=1 Tax=Paenibacillus xylanexedens TaxID=528191 RepID=UPI0016425586
MKGVGVIVEYNGVDKGDVYDLRECGGVRGGDGVVGVMRGGLVERGEGGMVGKRGRSEMGVDGGGD